VKVEEKGEKSAAARLDDENDDALSQPISNNDSFVDEKGGGGVKVKGRVETSFCLLHRMGSASSNAHRIHIAQLWERVREKERERERGRGRDTEMASARRHTAHTRETGSKVRCKRKGEKVFSFLFSPRERQHHQKRPMGHPGAEEHQRGAGADQQVTTERHVTHGALRIRALRILARHKQTPLLVALLGNVAL
jgi:hypothetical protein